MPDLKYAVIFSPIDQLSGKLSSFGGGFLDLGNRVQECGEKLSRAGESLTRWGERLSLDTMLMKDGAEKLRSLSDAITEPAFAMQKSLATTAAMTGLSNQELVKLKQTAIDFSNTHPGVTADQYVVGFTRMREIFQDTNKAMAAEGTAAMLSRFGIETSAATNLMTAAYSNLHVEATATGDQLMATVKAFGLAPESTQQLAMAVGRLGGTAAQTNTPLSELLALGGAASNQLAAGGRGAMMFASMIREMVTASAEGKSSIDWSRGMAGGLSQLRSQLAGMPTGEKIEFVKKLGAADPGMFLTFLDNLDQTLAKQRAIADSAGAAGTAYKTATADAADQLTLLHQTTAALYDSISSPALPWFTAQFGRLTSFVQGATAASEKHSAALAGGVFVMSAASNVAYGAISALSTLGGAAIFAGEGWQALGWAWKHGTDFESIALRAMYATETIGRFASGLGSAVTSLGNFGIALLANPITWYVAGALALAFVAYEIYEHWGHLGEWLSSMWGSLESVFAGFGKWAEGWALTLGKAVLIGITGPFGLIGIEIYKHWDSIKDACEKLGAGIRGFFVGSSPPPFGPLHDLGRITIAETIAERIRPAPVLA
ncbi:MAG: hypothetical protein WA005_14115, partial [Candidatus Binataceae bacterium]